MKDRLKRFVGITLLLFLPAVGMSQTQISTAEGLNGMTAAGNYIITADIDASGYTTKASFTGTLTAQAKADGTYPVISGLTKPLFGIANNATISNIMLKTVTVSRAGVVGAICDTANGTTRIYNCGILPTNATATTNSSVASTNDHCGSLVGFLDGTARVINCFSFATVSAGTGTGKYASGIVGYNNGTTTAAGINTMVMNCMFYGDITRGKQVSPVYGGTSISNLNSGGLNTFNFYAYSKLKSKSIANADFKCALAMEERYLVRFEFYRQLLNSNKRLAAYYITGNKTDTHLLLKWVLDKSIAPYPILKAQGKYPSIINYSTANLADYDEAHRNQGRKLGTLVVNIHKKSQKTTGGQDWPSGGDVQTTRLVLIRTDKDSANFNFNYDKVQLPYYNDVGTKNYTDSKVVTGWKITNIYGGTAGTYTASDTWGGYNFADRMCTNKDLYSVSGRVFSQGAYFDVPYGVDSITIEPYWGDAVYVADDYMDVVYNTGYTAQNVTQLGKVTGFSNGALVSINGSEQRFYTTIANAVSAMPTKSTVFDMAIVLVGNLHQAGAVSDKSKPFTLMSIDLDKDNEPDYSFIYHGTGRHSTCPLRFDFLNVPGTAQAQRPTGADKFCNASVFNAKSWFEITNTCLIYFSQFEYENSSKSGTAPIILLGGVYDQFVSTKNQEVKYTTYLHVGGNAWFHDFANGTHSDGHSKTKHIPISVTGGDYEDFHLTGTYNADADSATDDAECYISGGHFIEAAGAGLEKIKGNVRWQIYDADIENFYGGGINDAKPITGNITVDIINSHVGVYCGGPKFGNMAAGKKVTTTAKGCTFGKFFGAGYGGNSINRKKYFDFNTNIDWPTLQGYYTDDKGKYYDGASTAANQRPDLTSNADYGKKGPGVAVDFDYEFFIWTSGTTGARLFVKFAAFSLAQCNSVSSTLTRCTITDNFYGGGSLGKVSDTAYSILDSCTVLGNVFGAGYSATLSKVPVRSGGFVDNQHYPKINKYAGIFEDGVFTDTTHYSWKHVDRFPANGSQTFTGSNDSIITTTVITKDNLGSVGEAILILRGNTTVSGDVYGGGEESYVTAAAPKGNTSVTLEGSTHVVGNVFGGGNKGIVSGNSTVTIQDPEP